MFACYAKRGVPHAYKHVAFFGIAIDAVFMRMNRIATAFASQQTTAGERNDAVLAKRHAPSSALR